ncbi:MAG: hypothetical protein ACRCZI_14895 [Cetobacterium sp.]
MATLPTLTFEKEPGTFVETQPKGDVSVELGSVPLAMNQTQIQSQPTLPSLEVLDKVEPIKPPNFGLKLIATIAAFKGDLSPAFNLQNMERKTAVYNEFLQKRQRINQLLLSGKEDKAYEMLNLEGTRAMAIAPEMEPLVRGDLDRIYKKQATRLEAETLANTIQRRIDGNLIDPSTVKQAQSFVDGLREASKVARDSDSLKRFMDATGFSPHMMPNQNAIAFTSPYGGVKQVQMSEAFSEQQLKGPVGGILSEKTGLTTAQLTNIMNGVPVLDTQGNDIGQSLRPTISRILSTGKGIEAQIDLAGKAPITPEANIAQQRIYRAKGFSPSEANLLVAARGAVPKEFLDLVKGVRSMKVGVVDTSFEETSTQLVEERERLAKAPIQAQLQVNREAPLQQTPAGALNVAINTDIDNPDSFGTQNASASLKNVEESGGKISLGTRDSYKNITQPSIRVLRDLGRAKDALQYFGQPDSTLSRAALAAKRYAVTWIGSNDPNITAGEAAALMAERAIESLAGTAKIPDAEVGKMKRLVSGLGAGVSGAEAAVSELQQSLMEHIKAASEVSSSLTAKDVKPVTRLQPVEATSTPQPISKAFTAGISIIQGVDDINSPVQQSSGWESARSVMDIEPGGSVTVKQLAQVLLSERVATLKSKGIKDVDRFLLTGSDTKDIVLQKMNEAETLLSGSQQSVPKKPRGPVILNK